MSIEQSVVKCCRRGDAASPFAIYANNRMAALRSALEKNFPAVMHFCDSDTIRPLLREFCQLYPPRMPYLVFYGEQLSEFLRSRLLFIEADLAALDYARLSALMAPDVSSVSPNQISDPEQLQRIRLNPAFCVCACQVENLKLWLSITETELAVAEVTESQSVDALFYRDEQLRINLLTLSEPESLFLECLIQGCDAHRSAERVAEGYPDFALSDWFGNLLIMGAFYDES